MPRSTGAMRASEKSPTAVRQLALLSRPTRRQPTPITTTGLPFSIYLDADGEIGVQIVG
jgi:hypothetical protein